MIIKQEPKKANGQHLKPYANVLKFRNSKQDVFDHWKRCRAVYPIRQDSEVIE